MFRETWRFRCRAGFTVEHRSILKTADGLIECIYSPDLACILHPASIPSVQLVDIAVESSTVCIMFASYEEWAVFSFLVPPGLSAAFLETSCVYDVLSRFEVLHRTPPTVE